MIRINSPGLCRIELHAKEVLNFGDTARVTGIEPTTRGFGIRCSTSLSYTRRGVSDFAFADRAVAIGRGW